jgi:pyridinium-3,5-biscarboxylic acid mononucleotide synthase
MPDSRDLEALLQQVLDGGVSVERAAEALREGGFEDLGFARVDEGRQARCGFPEVVFAERKTPGQIVRIMESLRDAHGYAFATRLVAEGLEAVRARWPDATVNEVARTALVGEVPPPPSDQPSVLVIAAGTSDLPVAEEAAESAAFARCAVEKLYDVGVAGIHRLFAGKDLLSTCGVAIVAAGMEGALPSVVGGLTRAPVIAVPTSVGYGVALGGMTALFGMLTSCASGVAVVNIDNGFGAGICAARIIRTGRRRT